MKKTVKIIASAATFVLTLMMLSSCGASKAVPSAAGNGFGDYTVENAGVGRDGTYVLKVTTRSARPDTELEVSAKNAVHAVLFSGIPAGGGFSAVAPLAGSASAESAHSAFFSNFFVSDYKDYVKSAAKNSAQIIRQKDNSYKTSAVISILKDDLRHHLEDNGIISKMVR